jgi:hypothetical protein
LNEEYARFGGRQEYGVDAQLEAMALRDGKKTGGLETPEEQFQLFSGLDRATEVRFLQRTLGEIGEVETFFNTLRREWRKGDLDTLENLLLSPDGDYGGLSPALFRERNLRWMETLDPLLRKEGAVLVVVGVGHVLGKEGLPALLERRGFTVRRVASPAP